MPGARTGPWAIMALKGKISNIWAIESSNFAVLIHHLKVTWSENFYCYKWSALLNDKESFFKFLWYLISFSCYPQISTISWWRHFVCRSQGKHIEIGVSDLWKVTVAGNISAELKEVLKIASWIYTMFRKAFLWKKTFLSRFFLEI